MRSCSNRAVLSFIVLLAACDFDKAKDSADAGKTAAPIRANVSGLVLDAIGHRIDDARVELDGQSVQTDELGQFTLVKVSAGAKRKLVVSRDGYSTGQVPIDISEAVTSYVKVTLVATEQAELDDSSQGGRVTTPSGVRIDVPPGSVVDEQGNPVQGKVVIAVTLLNDRDEIIAAPGGLMATDPQGSGDAKPLESFGMVSVDLSVDGKPAHLSGGGIALSFPLAAQHSFQEGDAIGLWSFDEAASLWTSRGDAHVGPDNTLESEVEHMSWWNADQVMLTTCVMGRILDAGGQPLSATSIIVEGRSYLGFSVATTDDQGAFCLEARVSSVVEMSALATIAGWSRVLAVRLNTPSELASCAQPSSCFQLPDDLVAVARQALCDPAACPADPQGSREACCKTELGPCDYMVAGDCGGSADGSWDSTPDAPGVEPIPGVPMGGRQTDAGADPSQGGQMGNGGGVQDAGLDAGADAGLDAAADAGFDAGADAGLDAGADAGDAGDADVDDDAGGDGGWWPWLDGAVDGGSDAAVSTADGGPLPYDGSVDAGDGSVWNEAGLPPDGGPLPYDGSVDAGDGSVWNEAGLPPDGGEPSVNPDASVDGAVAADAGGEPAAVCGDGQIGPQEECDDDAETAGDGCSATCAVEPGYTCFGTPSACAIYEAGDLCENADPLVDGSYPLSGFLPKVPCANNCGGADRWFSVNVPVGHTLQLSASAQDIGFGQLALFDVTNRDCSGLWDLEMEVRFGNLTAVQILWPNFLGTASDVRVQLEDMAYPESSATVALSYAIVPTGCGDSFLDDYGGYGPVEECDDGNALAGDGCSASCAVELGYACDGVPSVCIIPLPGDTCDTAQDLLSGSYDLNGYMRDTTCSNVCSGPDRWFVTTVPAGELLILDARVDIVFTTLHLFDLTLASCATLGDAVGISFVDSEDTQLAWQNTGQGVATIGVALQNRWGGTTDLAFHTAAPACGDGYLDVSGTYGGAEQCDDGNQANGDGCSSTCANP